MGSNIAPATRERTLDGQVRVSGGMSRSRARAGRTVLKPEMK
jgi:hypothetical protein